MGEYGNDGRYPDDWDRRRREVYKRDNYECQECGAKGGQSGNTELHCHHKTPVSQGGSHEKSNLITLCRACHGSKHDHLIGGETVAPPKRGVPASEQIINQEGETLAEFAQRFNEMQSESEVPQSTSRPRMRGQEQPRVTRSEQATHSESATAETSSETVQNISESGVSLLNQLIGSILVVGVVALIMYFIPPTFEVTNWPTVMVTGIIVLFFFAEEVVKVIR